MFKSLVSGVALASTRSKVPLVSQTRNTFILKRRYRYELSKRNTPPRPPSCRHFIYDLVEDTNFTKKENIDVILSTFVSGVGNPGDIINLPPGKAYSQLLLPRLAVYKTPENVVKYKTDKVQKKTFSSPYVEKLIESLSVALCTVTMNKTQPWVVEPWHVRVSLRKMGIIAPDYAIQLPPWEIRGPDLSLQNKEFYVTITINNTEKVNVRCRIHHWEIGENRIPYSYRHWEQPAEPIFPEQAEVLKQMVEVWKKYRETVKIKQ